MCVLRARQRGRLWQSRSSRSLSGKRVLQRIRREFFRARLLLSLVKAQRETLRAASARLNEYRESDDKHQRDRGTASGHPARSIRGGGQLRREIRQQGDGDHLLPTGKGRVHYSGI